MKNLKFGVFCLGLAVAIGGAVSGLSAQDRVRGRAARARRGDVMMLDGRGSAARRRWSATSTSRRRPAGRARSTTSTRTARPRRPGCKAGDVVVEYDGERVRSARQFTRLVQETPGRPHGEDRRAARRQEADASTRRPKRGRMTWNFGHRRRSRFAARSSAACASFRPNRFDVPLRRPRPAALRIPAARAG